MTISARHYARLGAVQYLYSWNVQTTSLESFDDQQCLINSDVFLHGDLNYFKTLIHNIPAKTPEIDAAISGVVHRELSEIDPVELAILRLGVYEMLFQPQVPFRVIANECIELSREFGNPDSYRFINGMLDKLESNQKSSTESKHSELDAIFTGSESQIIDKHFAKPQINFSDTIITGIGDDGAVLNIPSGNKLVVSTDTSIEDIHFPAAASPEDVGYRALAIALSDLAAMGARPSHVMLNLSVPKYDSSWMEQFSSGFFQLVDQYHMALIGGDTVKGPLNIGVTVFGLVDQASCLTRSGAQVGDGIYVTGTLGDAALGLQKANLKLSKNSRYLFFRNRYLRPTPRIETGHALLNHATSAIDISDGLITDLSHILRASSVGAQINLEFIPLSAPYKRQLSKIGWNFAISHGDDYELCFTLPPGNEEFLDALRKQTSVTIQRIGVVTEEAGLRIVGSDGESFTPKNIGYSHFLN